MCVCVCVAHTARRRRRRAVDCVGRRNVAKETDVLSLNLFAFHVGGVFALETVCVCVKDGEVC